MAEKKVSTRIINLGHADKPICPNCKQCYFKIYDYGISEESSLGSYYFVAVCRNCGQKIKYYKDI
jgi:RNase P subunit RPR2